MLSNPTIFILLFISSQLFRLSPDEDYQVIERIGYQMSFTGRIQSLFYVLHPPYMHHSLNLIQGLRRRDLKNKGNSCLNALLCDPEVDNKLYLDRIVNLSYYSEDSLLIDIEGNSYRVIQIGDQVWMAENLKTTKFSDGIDIPLITDDNKWANSMGPGYCWYNNDENSNKDHYGALYNLFTVNTDKLCPDGWRVPADEEWQQLELYLGMNKTDIIKKNWRGTLIGGKLKGRKTDPYAHPRWNRPNRSAIDEVGFSAYPGGYRNLDGDFLAKGFGGAWWSSTPAGNFKAWDRFLVHDKSSIYRNNDNREFGFSVRCIKD